MVLGLKRGVSRPGVDREPRRLPAGGNRTFPRFATPSNLEPAPVQQLPRPFDTFVNKPLSADDRVFGRDKCLKSAFKRALEFYWHSDTIAKRVEMGIQKLTAMCKPSGEIVFSCPECHGLALPAYGAQDKDQLAYLMICSGCGIILGEWPTAQERTQDLKAFAAKAKEGLA